MNDATRLLDFPDDYPKGKRTNVTQMRNVQEAGPTEFDDHVKQSKFVPRHLVDIKVDIDSLLLKQNNTMSM